nr:MipA/OmpV family protein [Chelativorans sp.]
MIVGIPLAGAQERPRYPWSGDWYLTVGAVGLVAPKFEGAERRAFTIQPIISLGRQGSSVPFSSRNDNISLAFIDTQTFRAGIAGKLVFRRDGDTADELEGLDPVRFGVEVGGFAEVYPTDWLRIRGEVRRGFRSHEGIVADVAADAFTDLTPTLRLSGGPRISFASQEYFDAHYGVDAEDAVESGLSRYDPGGGIKSVGAGGALTWQTTEKITTSIFAEYERLMGPAADSSLVEERGSANQLSFGLSATYRFDFSLP